MLIAALIALFSLLGGDSGLETLFRNLDKSLVKEHISAEDTREQISSLSKELGIELERNREELSTRIDSFLTVQKDWSASREQYQSLGDEIMSLLSSRHDSALRTRQSMRDLLTEEEWNGLFQDR